MLAGNHHAVQSDRLSILILYSNLGLPVRQAALASGSYFRHSSGMLSAIRKNARYILFPWIYPASASIYYIQFSNKPRQNTDCNKQLLKDSRLFFHFFQNACSNGFSNNYGCGGSSSHCCRFYQQKQRGRYTVCRNCCSDVKSPRICAGKKLTSRNSTPQTISPAHTDAAASFFIGCICFFPQWIFYAYRTKKHSRYVLQEHLAHSPALL